VLEVSTPSHHRPLERELAVAHWLVSLYVNLNPTDLSIITFSSFPRGLDWTPLHAFVALESSTTLLQLICIYTVMIPS